MFDVSGSLDELREKSYIDIQTETAWKWGGRAAAAYQLVVESGDVKKKIDWWLLGEEYFHESIEHAALGDHTGGLTGEVTAAIQPIQDQAFDEINRL